LAPAENGGSGAAEQRAGSIATGGRWREGGEVDMYAVIRRYSFDPTNAVEIGRHVRQGFVPLIKGVPGFMGYYWIDSGSGTGISVSVFADKSGAEESVHAAAEYVKKYLTPLLGQPEVIVGRVMAHG
jgi:hypothetical protein